MMVDSHVLLSHILSGIMWLLQFLPTSCQELGREWLSSNLVFFGGFLRAVFLGLVTTGHTQLLCHAIVKYTVRSKLLG